MAAARSWARAARAAHYRMEAHEALPAPAAVRRSRPRRPGQPGAPARERHRGVVTVSDRPADRPVPPLARASARKRVYTADGTNDGTNAERRAMGRGQHAAHAGARPRTGTLGGSNRMLSAREVAAILSVPSAPSARNGGTGNCPPTGSESTYVGRTRSLRLDRPPRRVGSLAPSTSERSTSRGSSGPVSDSCDRHPT